MARLAINELTTFRWSFEEDVEHYRAAGAAGIGVWREKLADYGAESGARLLKQSGLIASSLNWAGGFTGSSGLTYEEALADAREAIFTAELIGARCLIIHSGARGVHTHKHARRLFRQALDKLLPLAEERGLKLALEPMMGNCGGDFTFFNCLDEAHKLLIECGSPALGITLDTYHWGHHPLLLDRLPLFAEHLALVQLGDARQPPHGEENRCQLGDGQIPLREIVERLMAAGYDGFFEVELIGEEIEAADNCETLQRSVQSFRDWTEKSKAQGPKSKVAQS